MDDAFFLLVNGLLRGNSWYSWRMNGICHESSEDFIVLMAKQAINVLVLVLAFC